MLAVLYLDGSRDHRGRRWSVKRSDQPSGVVARRYPTDRRALGSLKAVPKLKQLNIKGCGLGFEDIDAFETARPAVKLE